MGCPNSAPRPLCIPGTGSPSLSLSASLLVSNDSVFRLPPACSGSLSPLHLLISVPFSVSSSLFFSLSWLQTGSLPLYLSFRFFLVSFPFIYLFTYLLIYLFIYVSSWHNVGLELTTLRSRVICSARQACLKFSFCPFLSLSVLASPHPPPTCLPVSSPLSLSLTVLVPSLQPGRPRATAGCSPKLQIPRRWAGRDWVQGGVKAVSGTPPSHPFLFTPHPPLVVMGVDTSWAAGTAGKSLPEGFAWSRGIA